MCSSDLVFYTKDNEYIGEQVITKGDTVLFTEAHQMFFEEDSTVLEIKQGTNTALEDLGKVNLQKTADSISEIGRASCMERVYIEYVLVALSQKRASQ